MYIVTHKYSVMCTYSSRKQSFNMYFTGCSLVYAKSVHAAMRLYIHMYIYIPHADRDSKKMLDKCCRTLLCCLKGGS